MLTAAVVDQSWSRPSDFDAPMGVWLVPLVIIAILIGAGLVEKRPWVLLAIGLTLVVVVPVSSCILR